MKALVNVAPGPKQVQLQEVPEPVAGPGLVKISIQSAGICGSDLSTYFDGTYPTRTPVILCHEIAGEIVELGAGVSTFKVGDRVTALSSVRVCGKCAYCQAGELSLCVDRDAFGTHVDGGFAEYIAVPERNVRLLPDNISFDEGVLAEPLACCVKGAMFLTSIVPGDLVLVSGPGTLGLCCVQLAKLQGAKVILSGVTADEYRLNVGRELGTDVSVKVDKEDLAKLVGDLSDGRGLDVAIECSGAPAAIRAGLQLMRKQGHYTQMGIPGKPFELDYRQIVMKELRVAGSCATSVKSWARSLRLLEEGLVKVQPLVSGGLPLSEFERAFDMARSGEGIKVIFHPHS
jgi:L-iditol 2-dehydrogenase